MHELSARVRIYYALCRLLVEPRRGTRNWRTGRPAALPRGKSRNSTAPSA